MFPLSRLARLTVTQRFLFHKGSFLPNFSREANARSAPDVLGELILLLVSAAAAAVSVRRSRWELRSLATVENPCTQLCGPCARPLRGISGPSSLPQGSPVPSALAGTHKHLRSTRPRPWHRPNTAEKHAMLFCRQMLYVNINPRSQTLILYSVMLLLGCSLFILP